MNFGSRYYSLAAMHSIIIVVFFLLTTVFFYPSMFGDSSLAQNDIMQWRAGAKELIDHRKNTGEEGLWTNSMFGGMPSTLVSTEFSGDIFQDIEQWYNLGFNGPSRIFFALLFSMYIMLLLFGVRPFLAALGAIVFCLSSYHIIGIAAGHNAKIRAVAYIPLIIGGIHYAYQKNKWIGGLIFSIGTVFELRVNHLQITYYYLFVIFFFLCYYLWQYIENKQQISFLKISGVLFLGGILALGTNYGRLSMILDYAKNSTRGKSELTIKNKTKGGLSKAYAFEYNNSYIEPLTMFFPHILGGGSHENIGLNSNLALALKKNARLSGPQLRQQVKGTPMYYGQQSYTLPYHLGFIALVLFLLGCFVLPKSKRLLLLGIFFLGIFFSWGKNFSGFNYFMFDYFPGFNKFRSVTFAITISHFACVLIGILGLDRFLMLGRENKTACLTALKKTSIVILGITMLLLLSSYIGRFSGPVDSNFIEYKWFLNALRSDRASFLRQDALLTLLYSSIVLVLLYNVLEQRVKMSETITVGIITLFCLYQLVIFNKQYLYPEKFQRHTYKSFFTPEPSDEQIKLDKDKNYRVVNLINPFSDAKASIHHKSIGGYHAVKLQRYQDLMDEYINDEIAQVSKQISEGLIDTTRPVLNMLNTKYFKFGSEAHAVVPNKQAYGHGWFPKEIITVDSPDDEIKAIKGRNLKDIAIIDNSKFVDIPPIAKDSVSTISLINYEPNVLKYKAESKTAGLAVFSEIYYPYWKAYIDGNETPILRVNYILRGINIPAGISSITFRYEDPKYASGNMIMLISSIILLLCIFSGLAYYIRKSYIRN